MTPLKLLALIYATRKPMREDRCRGCNHLLLFGLQHRCQQPVGRYGGPR